MSSTDSPAPSFSRINSTLIRVPAITGLPFRIARSDTMRGSVISASHHGQTSLSILSAGIRQLHPISVAVRSQSGNSLHHPPGARPMEPVLVAAYTRMLESRLCSADEILEDPVLRAEFLDIARESHPGRPERELLHGL